MALRQFPAGVVDVSAEISPNKSIDIARLGAGDFFGEMSLMTGAPRSATITCVTDTYLFEISKKDILPILEENPELCKPLSEVLTRRQIETEAHKKIDQISETEKASLFRKTLSKIQNFFSL